MSGFFSAPAFVPNVPPIPLGTNGQVLTMVGGLPEFAAASAGGAVGTARVAVALAAGATNNLLPIAAWPGSGATQYGRLILTAPSGAANVTGLAAGNDGQWIVIANHDGANNITLNSLNGASSAANQFSYAADLILPPGASVVAVYDGTLAKWVLA